jgi:hypothetical protein
MKLFSLFFTLALCTSSYALEDKVVLKNIKKMGKELKQELQAGMKKSPSDALKVCNVKAPLIEGKYKDASLKIGRVSLKNRNPNNKPKEWMLKYIEGFHNKTIKEGYLVVKIDNKRKGLLKPIVTLPNCLNCHGPNIQADLDKEILDLYPNDKARGYSVGEIRGFFWAEYDS